MTVIVRALRPDDRADVEAFARVRHLALPHILWTPDAIVHNLAHTHPDARFVALVAEEDGEVIGTAQVQLAYDSPEPGLGMLNIYVHPDRTRRGAGGLLVRTAEAHLVEHGATKLYAWVLDEPANRAFAERHGYGASRSAHFLRLDLTGGTLPPLRTPAPGVELRSAADFADDPRPLFELDAETARDEPSDVDTEFTDYENWIEESWKHPLLNRELTKVALVEGRPAAFSLAWTDVATGRYATAMTGTARAFRGRGLAKLAKNASLHGARAAGFTEALTGNDDGNGPMLAINKWFGYEICATEVRHVRELG
ncbi:MULTISPECIES: GNAT family N-acetyltransferase [unclassified Streptomyces]|uniref:GNAT family N-acetyltransferase n=1 Tax=unclassified Streptomyces TaxID=2593676 RepID=UPI0022529CD8|nr:MULTISPECIES: GNAT family N-acetyltransferase [unclassified Streptomyces]MCX5047090.1 GNAT family N-acetyltransferase [Streptomyces sp. NBC_00474]MCX5058210.1 GNAT family N-acetyltransferase [Streptomyces sp. NBC_00452]MCX5244910.1 GNAT family N-acetyltransferase [Streptomyces sp. NBC_00201]MCX5289358.1 GNAT family N-acetyltransferase [Streptomyces sp. NBC_00183]